MKYELYYWPTIQGRGEFVRLALEDVGADYVDIARAPAGDRMGMPALLGLLADAGLERPPFAPPFLKAGKLIIGQTANILLYLGEQCGLAAKSDAGRLWAHQLQLTIADFVTEIHDTHHPVASALYYEEQRDEAAVRAADFLARRAPKFLDYFERLLARQPTGRGYLAGRRRSHADLSLFQVVAGLRYAFPKNMARLEKKIPRVVDLHDRIAERPNIRAYLASPRRIAFNQDGVFRRYPELDR
jgi:glutathione S-transferase